MHYLEVRYVHLFGEGGGSEFVGFSVFFIPFKFFGWRGNARELLPGQPAQLEIVLGMGGIRMEGWGPKLAFAIGHLIEKGATSHSL